MSDKLETKKNLNSYYHTLDGYVIKFKKNRNNNSKIYQCNSRLKTPSLKMYDTKKFKIRLQNNQHKSSN